MVRGYKEVEESKGVTLKKFKLTYDSYCDTKGLAKMPLNTKSINDVCQKFGIEYDKNKEIFKKVKLLKNFKTTRGGFENEMDDSKEKFFFGPICFLVYFFFVRFSA